MRKSVIIHNYKKIILVFVFISLSIMGENTDSILAQSLYSHVQFLSNTPGYRNHLNIHSLNIAAGYIDSVFSMFSHRVEIQSFTVDSLSYQNIICSFGPEAGERIIVGAHYDVCYFQSGADDNASGVAGLLELARLLSENTTELERRIDLVAYSLEEPPNFKRESMGSYVHAKRLYDSKVDIKLMISLDMIGYFDENPNTQHFPIGLMKLFYPDKANFIAVISNYQNYFSGVKVKRLLSKNSSIKVCQFSGPSILEGIDFSDHLNFWKFGYDAVFISDTAFYRNQNYHKKTDTIETLNFELLSELVKGIHLTIKQL